MVWRICLCNSYVISVLQKCKSMEKAINSLKSHWCWIAWMYPMSLDQQLWGRAQSMGVCHTQLLADPWGQNSGSGGFLPWTPTSVLQFSESWFHCFVRDEARYHYLFS